MAATRPSRPAPGRGPRRAAALLAAGLLAAGAAAACGPSSGSRAGTSPSSTPGASPGASRPVYRGGDTGLEPDPDPAATAAPGTVPTGSPGAATGSATALPASPPRLSVTPARAPYDEPLSISVAGLTPGETVVLRASSRDDDGQTWRSAAAFVADRSGRVSTRQAPVGGDYATARPMGLVETLADSSGPRDDFAAPERWTVRFAVDRGGVERAATEVLRQYPEDTGVTERDLTVGRDGVSGELWLPARRPATPATAVVVFGGSEGGLSTSDQAALLAEHGHPALALAYFDAPGLPDTLTRVPLEYFRTAARRLARVSGVDPRRIVLWGTSRGGEAALLAGSDFPADVAGVVATVPSSVVLDGDEGPAWTLGGRDVTAAPDSADEDPDPASRWQIPVERIAGPVLGVCGGQDLLGPSCAHVEAVRDRLAAHHSRYRATALEYPDAGHYVGSIDPWYPTTSTSFEDHDGAPVGTGGSYQADQAGEADAWPRILSWLDRLPAGR